MKIKKVIAAVCAAAISVGALSMSVGAANVSFSKEAGGVPVRGSLSLDSRMVVAMASIGDNPDNYKIAQVRVYNLDYTRETISTGAQYIYTVNTKWGTGGNGCQGIVDTKYYKIVSAEAQFEFNINGQIYSGARYKLSTKL